jgi:hypothetical protein
MNLRFGRFEFLSSNFGQMSVKRYVYLSDYYGRYPWILRHFKVI